MPRKTTLPSVAQLFTEAKRSSATHKKGLRLMQKIRAESEPNEFIKLIIDCLQHALLVFKREAPVERIVRFVIAFTVARDEGDEERVRAL